MAKQSCPPLPHAWVVRWVVRARRSSHLSSPEAWKITLSIRTYVECATVHEWVREKRTIEALPRAKRHVWLDEGARCLALLLILLNDLTAVQIHAFLQPRTAIPWCASGLRLDESASISTAENRMSLTYRYSAARMTVPFVRSHRSAMHEAALCATLQMWQKGDLCALRPVPQHCYILANTSLSVLLPSVNISIVADTTCGDRSLFYRPHLQFMIAGFMFFFFNRSIRALFSRPLLFR